MNLLAIASCFFAFSSGLLAQGITFVGPVVVGSNARLPPVLMPMVDLSVLAVLRPAASPTSPLVSHFGTTDAQGFFAVPPGHVVEQITTQLVSSRCRVLRPINMGLFSVPAPLPLVMNNPPATVDLTQAPVSPFYQSLGNGPLTGEECSAYYHARALAERADQLVGTTYNWSSQQITVQFEPSPAPSGTAASMTSNGLLHTLSIYPVSGAPANAFNAHHAARSETAIAHEIGHAALRFSQVTGAPSVGEALADYFAFALTGEPRIGYGVYQPLSVVRDLRVLHPYNPTESAHQKSRAFSGALYAASAPQGPVPVLGGLQSMSAYLQYALQAQPNPTESTLLYWLLAIASTPHAQALLCACAERSILSLPTHPSTVSLQPCVLGSGISNGSAPAPTLTPTYGTGSLQLDVDGAASNSLCMLALSGLPNQLWMVPGLPPLLLDPSSLASSAFLPTSSTGQLTVTMPIPLALPPMVLSAFVLDAAGPLGITATNGVYVGS